jgi:hypothetical protein
VAFNTLVQADGLLLSNFVAQALRYLIFVSIPGKPLGSPLLYSLPRVVILLHLSLERLT